MCKIVIVVSIFFQIHVVFGYGTGAPSPICEYGSIYSPKHGNYISSSHFWCPYEIVLEKSQTTVHKPILITLRSKEGSRSEDGFKGFFVQVRKIIDGETKTKVLNKDDRDFVGKFESDVENQKIKYLACSGTPNAAVTHLDPEPKTNIQLNWYPSTPGEYLVHTTFVYNFSTFWANLTKLIEVLPLPNEVAEANESQKNSQLCSTLKINPALDPVEVDEDSSNPYELMVGPKEGPSEKTNHHQAYQNQTFWINITSEFDTRILQAFVQVRPEKSSNATEAVGQFIKFPPKENQNWTLIDCFNGTKNAILFTNSDKYSATSDVSFLWKAPADKVGKFEIRATAISDETTFWDQVGNDPEARKITVLKKEDPSHNQQSVPILKPVSAGSSSLEHFALATLIIGILFIF